MGEPQVFHHYTLWEDFKAGMWMPPTTGAEGQAAAILSDPKVFGEAARVMVQEWPIAAEQNLTNPTVNRQAWIGQATCCHLAGVPESATRAAWWTLTDEERTIANGVADQVIREWEQTREWARQPTLFGVDDA